MGRNLLKVSGCIFVRTRLTISLTSTQQRRVTRDVRPKTGHRRRGVARSIPFSTNRSHREQGKLQDNMKNVGSRVTLVKSSHFQFSRIETLVPAQLHGSDQMLKPSLVRAPPAFLPSFLSCRFERRRSFGSSSELSQKCNLYMNIGSPDAAGCVKMNARRIVPFFECTESALR